MAAAACGWSLAASSAAADPRRFVDLPAGSLSDALAALARQTGASFGSALPLPPVAVAALHGRLSTAGALRRLLVGARWHAVALGGDAWRLEPLLPSRRRRPPVQPPGPPVSAPPTDIVVTATKRDERLATAPFPLAVLPADALRPLGPAPDTAAAATLVNGLSVTNLGGGRDRLFVRGVADSPFDGFGQSSVSVQVGEARATYDAPDPDLRLVDMAQVELLKGPQGPLYGTGALGGVWRLVPAAPALDRASGHVEGDGSLTANGAAAGMVEAVVNLPIIADRIGVRLVGYREGQGGWIDDVGGRRDVNGGQTSGLRLGVRWAPTSDWTLDVTALTQLSSAIDSQYVERRDSLSRVVRAPEPQDTDFALAGVTARGRLGALDVTAVASSSWQQLQTSYDVGSLAPLLGGVSPSVYSDDRQYRVSTGELRVGGHGRRIDWLVGASLLDATTNATGTLTGAGGGSTILRFRRQVDEVALFGETTWHLASRLDAVGGLRVFVSAIDDQRRDLGDSAATSRASAKATPSATLSWRPAPSLLIYARYASALRPGGIEAPSALGGATAAYGGDRLASFDLGARLSTGRLFVDADVFRTRWRDVQAEMIAPSGLVGTGNFGDARNVGLDLTLRWTAGSHWTLASGLLVQHPRLALPGDAGYERQLPIVPDVSGHAELGYRIETGRWRIDAQLRAGYRGPARLTFVPGLDRRLDPVLITGSSLQARRGGWAWRLTVDNVADGRADTFPFGNPFSVASTDQHTPQRPRAATVSIRRDW